MAEWRGGEKLIGDNGRIKVISRSREKNFVDLGRGDDVIRSVITLITVFNQAGHKRKKDWCQSVPSSNTVLVLRKDF